LTFFFYFWKPQHILDSFFFQPKVSNPQDYKPITLHFPFSFLPNLEIIRHSTYVRRKKKTPHIWD
jgi:hypothetical protein